jgi:hypothetical protein
VEAIFPFNFHVFLALTMKIQFTNPFILHSHALTCENLKKTSSVLIAGGGEVNWETFFQMNFVLSDGIWRVEMFLASA